MLIEELQDSAVAFNLIFLFREAMAFIGKDDVFHGDSVLYPPRRCRVIRP